MHRIYIAGGPLDVPDAVLDGTPLTAAQKKKMTKAQAAAIAEYQRVSEVLWVVRSGRELARNCMAAAAKPALGRPTCAVFVRLSTARPTLILLLPADGHCCGQDDCRAVEGGQRRGARQPDLPELVRRASDWAA